MGGLKIIDMRGEDSAVLSDFKNLQVSEVKSSFVSHKPKLFTDKPFTKLFNKVFQLKERLKHDL
jgi:hypothetical protein